MSMSYIFKHTHSQSQHWASKSTKDSMYYTKYSLFLNKNNFCTNTFFRDGRPQLNREFIVSRLQQRSLRYNVFYMQEKWKHSDAPRQAEWVDFPQRSSQLVSHVSELRCALRGINLNKTIKSQGWTIPSISPGCLLWFKLTELYGIFVCHQRLGMCE